MIQFFELAILSKIREDIRSIMKQFKSLWEIFSNVLKDEYFLKDNN